MRHIVGINKEEEWSVQPVDHLYYCNDLRLSVLFKKRKKKRGRCWVAQTLKAGWALKNASRLRSGALVERSAPHRERTETYRQHYYYYFYDIIFLSSAERKYTLVIHRHHLEHFSFLIGAWRMLLIWLISLEATGEKAKWRRLLYTTCS